MCRRTKIEEQIKKNVIIDEEGCWIWQGSHSGNGRGGYYGRISIDGATMAVHRVMWTNIHGIIPHGKQIDHTCTKRLCCNPDHLEMTTPIKNQRRKIQRMKHAKKNEKVQGLVLVRSGMGNGSGGSDDRRAEILANRSDITSIRRTPLCRDQSISFTGSDVRATLSAPCGHGL